VEVLDLLRQIAAADPRAGAWCAAQCARTALHLVPAGEDRPRRALEVAEAWARGLATDEDCAVARGDVESAGSDVGELAPRSIAVRAVSHAISSAHAAVAGCACGAGATTPLESSATQAAWAIVLTTDPARWHAEFHRQLERLHERVQAERWPLTVPAPEQLLAAPAAVQVAWDALGDRAVAEQTVLALVEAHARAGRLGLRWDDPAQRAVAERTVDEVRTARLLDATVPAHRVQ